MSRCLWQRDQTPIQKKPNTENSSKPNTKVFIKKKKKIPNTQTKTKPSNRRTVTSPSSSLQLTHRRCRRSPGRPSSQIVDRRSEIGERKSLCLCSGARYTVLPPALPQGISLSFSLTLSQSLSLYLTEMKK